MQKEELRKEHKPGGEGEGDDPARFYCGDPGVRKTFIIGGSL